MGSVVVYENEVEFAPVKWGRSKKLVNPEKTGSKYIGVGITEYAPATAHELHQHPGQEEVIYVLEGEGITRTNAGDQPIGPGAFVFIPADTDHATINVQSDKPMKAIIMKGPPNQG